MKKFKMVALMMLVFILITGLSACKKDSNLIKVQLNEVAHSVFYAPQYVAIELGYFKEEGLDVKLVNGLGADKTMTAVLSGKAKLALCSI